LGGGPVLAAGEGRIWNWATLARRFHEIPRSTSGALWCRLVYSVCMTQTEKSVRQSVSIPARVARRVRALAKTRKTSANRVLVDLIEAGLESKEAQKKRFFALANKLTESTDPAERQQLKEELARMTFGD
jgi:hypothetical protein